MSDVAEPSELVNRLHRLRISRGLTIQQMAEKCGVPKSSLESYMKMSGAKRPGIDALIAIADGMDVSIDWLVGRAVDSHYPQLSQKDYAIACFSVVTSLIDWMKKQQNGSNKPIIDNNSIAGFDESEVAAKSMLIFVERMRLFHDNAHSVGGWRRDFYDRLDTLLAQEKPETT